MDPLQELEGWDAGRQLALMKKLGGRENAYAVLRDELEIVLQQKIKILFDKHGRCIPEGLSANVCDANRKFRLNQPDLTKEAHYANRIVRLHGKLGVDTGVTAKQLQKETECLLGLIRENTLTANIANGVYLPVVCPKLITNDLSGELKYYLTAVGKSYADLFPLRKFYNHRKGTLDSTVSAIEGSRHGKLLERMKEEVVIGLYFPNSLQGFSINASREQMAFLPEGFILSGLDAVIAMIMYPDVLARDWNTLGLDLAALSWQSAEYSLYFKVYDDNLDFDLTDNLGYAYDYYSGGLLFVG